jgi:heterodisulfide reductase subunit A-like polyferredoxin
MRIIDFTKLKYDAGSAVEKNPLTIIADLCIFGGSSAGIAAAIQARRMGMNVVIVESSRHLGGLTTGG